MIEKLSLEAEQENRSARKRRAIMDAASDAFLAGGYRGTSMDQIAAAAGVSKQTVYKQFSDKQRLFSEIVSATVDEAGDPVSAEVEALAESTDLAADLGRLGRRQLELVMQPRILQLRRLVISEAARFPELGRMFMEQGAGRTVVALTASFRRLGERGVLRMDDPQLAAAQFNWLIMAAPVNRAMLLGLDEAPPAAEVRRWVSDGVHAFLRIYAPTPP